MENVLLFPTDSVEDCRDAIQSGGLKNYRKRISAELILKDGSRRYYRCRNVERAAVVSEVLTFVDAVERATNDKVMWRFKGDSTYHMGSDLPVDLSSNKNLKEKFKRFLNYFFELED